MCLYWNSYPGLLRVIGYYEFVLNVKISGMDIFFNAVFLFEVFKKYWSSLLQQECVLSLLEILWSQFSFQKNPSVLKGCLLASCSGHVFYSFITPLPPLSCRKALQQQLIGWPVALFSNLRGFLETSQLCMILFLLVFSFDPVPWTVASSWFWLTSSFLS